ncbi:hypothetical protein [Aurantivibrio plasticivorans]
MTQVFILQNQDKLFLNKKNEWTDGRDLGSLYKTPHKDEAVNQIFEVSSKDYNQRIQMVSCEVSDKGLPQIDPDIMPPPLPKEDSSEQLALEGVAGETEDKPLISDETNTTTFMGSSDAGSAESSSDMAVNQA